MSLKLPQWKQQRKKARKNFLKAMMQLKTARPKKVRKKAVKKRSTSRKKRMSSSMARMCASRTTRRRSLKAFCISSVKTVSRSNSLP